MTTTKLETITLGGGCFWCLEAVYQRVKGVEKVVSGYAGDTEDTANYKMVCSGRTRHAEVVQVHFHPEVVSLEELLDVFWTIHDPTTPNRQGNDVGPQYRSIIFHENEAQRAVAEKSMEEVAPEIWDAPIVTELEALDTFYAAEDYHQNYYNKVGRRNPYCSFVITPKVSKFRKKFADKLVAAE